ncbi:MAG: hypothetical protein ISR44_00485 [Rhodospirillales bacterium]|nr:hypothetical protein [Rhodospirillales bacterium]
MIRNFQAIWRRSEYPAGVCVFPVVLVTTWQLACAAMMARTQVLSNTKRRDRMTVLNFAMSLDIRGSLPDQRGETQRRKILFPPPLMEKRVENILVFGQSSLLESIPVLKNSRKIEIKDKKRKNLKK